MATMTAPTTEWLAARGWKAFPFQREVWREMAKGRSGLLHATTGSGKTLAVWLGALQRLAQVRGRGGAPPLSVLWLTPMRALAADTTRALNEAAQALAPHWTLGLRTGDTGSAERAAQSRRLPTALVTTPESLSLLLARADAREALGSVRVVIVDEWHELVGNKRGVQVQLALARLRAWSPGLVVWGLSATLGDADAACRWMNAVSPHSVEVLRAPQSGPGVRLQIRGYEEPPEGAGIDEIAENEVENRSAEQQQEHRLAHRLERDAEQASTRFPRKIVMTERRKAPLCLCRTQAEKCVGAHRTQPRPIVRKLHARECTRGSE